MKHRLMIIQGDSFVCSRIRMYDALSAKGIMPKRIQSDKFAPDRVVWIYRITPEFCDELRKAWRNAYNEKLIIKRGKINA